MRLSGIPGLSCVYQSLLFADMHLQCCPQGARYGHRRSGSRSDARFTAKAYPCQSAWNQPLAH